MEKFPEHDPSTIIFYRPANDCHAAAAASLFRSVFPSDAPSRIVVLVLCYITVVVVVVVVAVTNSCGAPGPRQVRFWGNATRDAAKKGFSTRGTAGKGFSDGRGGRER